MNFIPLKYTSFEIPPAIFQLNFNSLLISILLAMLTLKYDFERCQKPRGGGGGGDSVIKVGTDVPRVQNLGREKFPQKPNDRGSFHEL